VTSWVPLLGEIFQPPSRTFAVLDAARDERIYPALITADCEWACLYRGDAAARMAEVAPYLVELHPLANFTAWLIETAWGNSWGVFLNTPLPLERVQAHLRRFLMARMPDDKVVYFRFYDPRVLRVYLPTCTPEESAAFFGPITRYVVEGDEPFIFERGT
jgi:uncharacterized protein DUF4123